MREFGAIGVKCGKSQSLAFLEQTRSKCCNRGYTSIGSNSQWLSKCFCCTIIYFELCIETMCQKKKCELKKTYLHQLIYIYYYIDYTCWLKIRMPRTLKTLRISMIRCIIQLLQNYTCGLCELINNYFGCLNINLPV